MLRLAHLRFGIDRRRRCDVLFLRSGQVTELEPHLHPHKYVDLEYGSRRVILHPIFFALLVKNLLRMSTQRAFLKTYVQFYRTPSVISYDNIPGAWDWADVLDRPMLCVQHGMRQMEESKSTVAGESNVILLSWGELQRDDYVCGRTPRIPNSSHDRKPKTVIPIGSLRDSMYRATKYVPDINANQLCVISQFKGLSGVGLALPEQRQRNIETLLDFTRRYALEHGCTIAIALYAKKPEKQRIEVEWYRSLFGELCTFNDPSTEFATYRLADESAIALGVHTSVLWEQFGRGRKILACNFTGETIFEFPVKGPWYLTETSYEAFRDRLSMLRGLSAKEFMSLVGEMDKHVIAYDPDNPTHLAISRLIEREKTAQREA